MLWLKYITFISVGLHYIQYICINRVEYFPQNFLQSNIFFDYDVRMFYLDLKLNKKTISNY